MADTTIKSHEGKKYLRKIHAPPGAECGGFVAESKPDGTILHLLHLTKMWMEVDVYAVLEAFNVRCPAVGHAIKKLLACGVRGKGGVEDDLKGAIAAINRAIEMHRCRTEEDGEGKTVFEKMYEGMMVEWDLVPGVPPGLGLKRKDCYIDPALPEPAFDGGEPRPATGMSVVLSAAKKAINKAWDYQRLQNYNSHQWTMLAIEHSTKPTKPYEVAEVKNQFCKACGVTVAGFCDNGYRSCHETSSPPRCVGEEISRVTIGVDYRPPTEPLSDDGSGR